MEDALKRLDKLTHEEARMATAQVLKDVRAVDNKVTEVIDGTQAIFTRSRKQIYNLETPRRQGSQTSHTTNGKRRRPNEMFVFS